MSIGLLAASFARGASLPPVEPWCGTGGGELPDLWQQVWLEAEALDEIGRAKAWQAASGRASLLLNQLALLQRGSVREGDVTMERISKLLPAMTEWRARLNDAAQYGDSAAFATAVTEARQRLEKLQASYSPAALAARSSASPLTATVSNTLTLHVEAPRLLTNFPAFVRLRLRDGRGRALTEADFAEAHTRKLHAFVVDPALEDYHHEHPEPTGVAGEFAFTFTPRQPGHYVLWVDAMPVSTLRNEFPQATLRAFVPATNAPVWRTQLDSADGSLRQRLRLDRKTVRAGEVVTARLRVTDAEGRPCFALEPWMGAFAHVVGVMDDRRTLLHVHSPGEPPAPAQRSGPEVVFRFVAPQAGYLKLFVQTKVDGQVKLARFGIPVE